MTTSRVLASPQPKIDPKRPAPAPTGREEEAPKAAAQPEPDERWSDMPCTD
jgi:hypothetical protein